MYQSLSSAYLLLTLRSIFWIATKQSSETKVLSATASGFASYALIECKEAKPKSHSHPLAGSICHHEQIIDICRVEECGCGFIDLSSPDHFEACFPQIAISEEGVYLHAGNGFELVGAAALDSSTAWDLSLFLDKNQNFDSASPN